jgi:hypothetical protein
MGDGDGEMMMICDVHNMAQCNNQQSDNDS